MDGPRASLGTQFGANLFARVATACFLCGCLGTQDSYLYPYHSEDIPQDTELPPLPPLLMSNLNRL